jgi:hypothetical protein
MLLRLTALALWCAVVRAATAIPPVYVAAGGYDSPECGANWAQACATLLGAVYVVNERPDIDVAYLIRIGPGQFSELGCGGTLLRAAEIVGAGPSTLLHCDNLRFLVVTNASLSLSSVIVRNAVAIGGSFVPDVRGSGGAVSVQWRAGGGSRFAHFRDVVFLDCVGE